MEFYQNRLVKHKGKLMYTNASECKTKNMPCLDVAEVTNLIYDGQEHTIEGSFKQKHFNHSLTKNLV